MFGLLSNPFNLVLVAIALVHFFRRQPDRYWLWIIIMGQGLGALVYIAMEVVPDLGLLRDVYRAMDRHSRLRQMEEMVVQNPSAGNYEELADLYLQDRKWKRARECYDRAISSRTDSVDPFYRRGICEVELGDFAAALPDLERTVQAEPRYDLMRAPGLLAHVYARTGQPEKADALFRSALATSTLSETMYNYAQFLRSQGSNAEAGEWAQRILSKKAGMPGYLKRRERPWFRKASALLKQV
jgi:hypothetical protein